MKVRFECPRCKESLDGLREEVDAPVTCSVCKHCFAPQDWQVIDEPTVPEKLTDAQVAAAQVKKEADRIRDAAYYLYFAAMLCIFGGILALVITVATMSDSHPANAFGVAVDLFGSALMFYAIAQLVHIRANTHK